jgi:hypothetical protein
VSHLDHLSVCGHVVHHLKSTAGLFGVDPGMVAGDYAACLESSHPPQARRRRQPDLARQLDIGQPGVTAQEVNYRAIKAIHGRRVPKTRSGAATSAIALLPILVTVGTPRPATRRMEL